MSPRPAVVRLLLLLPVLVASSCATSDFDPARVLRAGSNLPDRFHPQGASGTDSGGGACRSPLVDPGHGTIIRMVRSGSGQGDYAVTDGRYGVKEGELLRVDCATGEAVGVVRR